MGICDGSPPYVVALVVIEQTVVVMVLEDSEMLYPHVVVEIAVKVSDCYEPAGAVTIKFGSPFPWMSP